MSWNAFVKWLSNWLTSLWNFLVASFGSEKKQLDKIIATQVLELAALGRIETAITALAKLFEKPPRPGRPHVKLISENGTMLNYSVKMPDATASDVVSWELSQAVDGAPATVVGTWKTGDPDLTVSYADNASVSLTVVEIDDAANRSDPSDPLTFTATDTLPPSQPGQPVVTLVGET